MFWVSPYWCDVFIFAHSRRIEQKNGLQIVEEKKALGIYHFFFFFFFHRENKKEKAALLGKQLY